MKTIRKILLAVTAAALVALLFGCGATATTATAVPSHLDAQTYSLGTQAVTAAQEYLDGKTQAEAAGKTLSDLYDQICALKIDDAQKSGYNQLVSIAVDAVRYDVENANASDLSSDLSVLSGYLSDSGAAA